MSLTVYSFSDRLLLLLLALIANAALGGPLSFYRAMGVRSPVAIFDTFIRAAEVKLNREQRSAAEKKFRGGLLVAILASAALASGQVLDVTLAQLHLPGLAVALALLTLSLPVRRVYDEAVYIARDIDAGKLEDARKTARLAVARNIGSMDAAALARTAIEHLAESYAQRIVPPALAYLLFGFPGLLVTCLATRLAMLWPLENPRCAEFGTWGRRLFQIITWVPLRMATLLLVLSAGFAPRGNPVAAFKTILKTWGAGPHAARNLPLSAMAGGLGLTLGGPYSMQMSYVDAPWIEGGPIKSTPADIRRALYLYAVACMLLTLTAALGIYYR